jgi:hypothetical protein
MEIGMCFEIGVGVGNEYCRGQHEDGVPSFEFFTDST